MTWAEIEQRIYYDIIRFEQKFKPRLYPHEVEIAATFDDRLKQWRKACKTISHNLSAIDRVITKVKELGPVRHHLAHGYPIYFIGLPKVPNYPNEPFLEIVEHRETMQRIRGHLSRAKATGATRIFLADIYVRYAISELERKWTEMAKLSDDLFAASDNILQSPKAPKLPRKKNPIVAV